MLLYSLIAVAIYVVGCFLFAMVTGFRDGEAMRDKDFAKDSGNLTYLFMFGWPLVVLGAPVLMTYNWAYGVGKKDRAT